MSILKKNGCKINVGCGDRKMWGYTNVDIRPDVQPDVVCDISKLSTKFSDAKVIYAAHVLEHFPLKASKFAPTTYKDILADWFEALGKGGTLRLAVPNMRAACDRYLATGNLAEVQAFFFGGQKYDFDFHFHGWDFDTLKYDLEQAGFSDVKGYDWRKTDHFYVDDYSQAYLPHMDKSTGLLMSLNVEAKKL